MKKKLLFFIACAIALVIVGALCKNDPKKSNQKQSSTKIEHKKSDSTAISQETVWSWASFKAFN